MSATHTRHTQGGYGGPLGLAVLLDRLQRVKRTGPESWVACCPAHDDKRPSLSIAVGRTGAVLLHCWSNRCAPHDIAGAIGLQLSDLFPPKPAADQTPEERQRMRELAKSSGWKAALGVLDLEAKICLIAVSDVLNGRPFSPLDLERLAVAERRISDALAVLS